MKRYDALTESALSASLVIAQRLGAVSQHEVQVSPLYTLN